MTIGWKTDEQVGDVKISRSVSVRGGGRRSAELSSSGRRAREEEKKKASECAGQADAVDLGLSVTGKVLAPLETKKDDRSSSCRGGEC